MSLCCRSYLSTPVELKSAIVREPLLVSPDHKVMEAIAKMSGGGAPGHTTQTVDSQLNDLYSEVRSSCVIVVEEKQVVGILTERDVVRLIAQQQPLESLLISQVMAHPVVTLRESDFTELFSAINLLEENHIRHLPILNERDRPVGLVTHQSLGQSIQRTYSLPLWLVAAAPVGIFYTDVTGKYTYVNERYCQLAGLTPEEATEEGWQERLHPDDRHRVAAEWDRSVQEYRPFQLECRLQRPDGTVKWVYGHCVAARDTNGQILGYVGSITDISERKQAERPLQQLHQALEAKDIRQCQQYEQESRLLAALMESSHEAIVTESNWESPDFTSVSSQDLRDPLRKIKAFGDRLKMERKQAEIRQTQLVEQLASINQELKDFAYIVSHDLKAPLRGIISLLHWLEKDYGPRLDENGREMLQLMGGRVKHMSDLIDGVLQYSRVGKLGEKKEQVELNTLVAGVIDAINPPKEIKITIETELPTVWAVRSRIQQVFQNLISNAVKYMGQPEGEVRMGHASVEGEWQFYVADTGVGIERRHFERIFQIFQTLTPPDRAESTGVGLAIVKKIVENYGGRIWVTSKMGLGSTFSFTLPKTSREG